MKSLILLGYGEMGPHALENLSENFHLLAVITPQERSRFRTKAVVTTEAIAGNFQIKVIQDEGLKGLHNIVAACRPDGVVICSYDKIIPRETLALSTFINVHHGDLPRYRGRANLNWAIINGRESIGLSIHQAVEELDAGGIYHTWKIPIEESDYIADLYAKVNESIRNHLSEVVEGVLNGDLHPCPQTGTPTYCCTRLPNDGKINWNTDAVKIRNLIRGVSRPFSGAFTHIDQDTAEKLTLWSADLLPSKIYEGNIPGRIARVIPGKGVEILTGTSPLLITDISYRGEERTADQVLGSTSLTLT